jgi:predicted AAA+ superfamily ATPase
MANNYFEGLPNRVKIIFESMIQNPNLRKHILLNGPPGSGKTSSAKLFVEALYGSESINSKFSRALFLNSSDERGLEAVRSRVYPFIRSSLHMLFQSSIEDKPKIIIFDEAETLTDQAQMALRPLLDENPKDVIIIFLCNSISRIHPSIVHKFLVLQLESPAPFDFKNRFTKILDSKQDSVSNIDILFRRGDIRFFLLNPDKKEECKRLWKTLIHTKKSDLHIVFSQINKTWMFHEIAMFIYFMAYLLNLLNDESTQYILQYTDSDFLKMVSYDTRIKLLATWFEKYVITPLDSWPTVH